MSKEYVANSGAEITTSDATAQPTFAAIYVGVGGDVKITTRHAEVLTFKNVPTGAILPVYDIALIWATGTTATNLVGLRSK